MRNKALLLILCLGGTLLGCSNKPDVGDIQATLNEGWGMCKGLKLTDIKKMNGIDHGNSYEVAFSYKLEILKDVSAEDAWYQATEAICQSVLIIPTFWAYGQLDHKFGQPLKKGDVINVNDSFTMIKSENGWIKQ